MKRFIYDNLLKHVDKKQISLLIGARQVGKTTLLHQLHTTLKKAGTPVCFLSLEDKRIRNLIGDSPEKLFQVIPKLPPKKKLIVFIDEIQYLPDPSNFLKFHYDLYVDKLKFIVSGSSSFYIDRNFKDSLAGRKRIFEMPPLTFGEMLRFKDREELLPYLNNGIIPLVYKDEIIRLFYEYLIFGGYPDVVLTETSVEKKEVLKELATAYAKKDVLEADLQKPDAYFLLMKLLAERTGELLNVNSLTSDIGLDNKTIERYLWVMEKSFHIHIVPPYYHNVSSEIRKMSKVFFSDSGLRNYLLGNFSPVGLRDDRGELLEAYVYHLLKQYFEDDSIKFWRTIKKQEVDFISNNLMGKSFAFEVKWNLKQFNPKKYHFFKTKYPQINLTCLHLDNILEINLREHGNEL